EHGYDPTPKEIARLEGSKLGIAVGLDMDAWVEKFMTGTKVFHVAEKVPTIPIDVEPIGEEEAHGEHGHDDHDDHDDHDAHGRADKARPEEAAKAEKKAEPEHEHDHEHKLGAPDPHVWLDPDRMLTAVDEIAGQLAAIDPAGKEAIA